MKKIFRYIYGSFSLLTLGIKGGSISLLTPGMKGKSFSTGFGGGFRPVRNAKSIHLFFRFDQFISYPIFLSTFLSYSTPFGNYTCYVKIRYDKDNFLMVGNQFGFSYNQDSELSMLYSNIQDRMEEFFNHYKLENEDIIYIELIFRPLQWRIESDVFLDRAKIEDLSLSTQRRLLDIQKIPISTNEDYLPKPLVVSLDNNQMVNHIQISINNENINFLDLILDKTKFLNKKHKDYITSFDSNTKFYHISGKSDYVSVIRELDHSTIEKIRYSMSGVLLSKIIDRKVDDNTIYRTKGSELIIIKDNSIISSSIPITFKSLDKVNIKGTSWLPNDNIGVIDTETYLNGDLHEIYALGFKTKLDNNPYMSYIDKDYDSSKLVINIIDELLRDKYSDFTFYCHNLGGYDVVFIVKVLNDFNEKVDINQQYILRPVLRDDKIIKLTISKGNNKLILVDSYCILTNSLTKLAKDFQVDTQKSVFPYKFSTRSNLFYHGIIPSIDQYDNISQIEYDNMYTENWSFEHETYKYLRNDLNALYEVLIRANKQFFDDYKINISEGGTISALAMKIYLDGYYYNNIPKIIKPSIYRELQLAYYGGITEVYKPYGENLFYYDVNSLYPYAALNDMPGLSSSKVTYFDSDQNIDNLFGFFQCDIESPKDFYLGLLPVRNPSGIECPLGRWTGWYFSEELKFAQENGYIINVKKGYIFNRVEKVFDNYINTIYKIKSNPTSNTQKSIAKSLLNNLLGRFGINLVKPITSLVSEETFQEISLMNKISSYKVIGNNKYIVSYIPSMDYKILKSHGLDMVELLKKYKDKEIQEKNNSSVVISAAVTAYARIHMAKIKLYILSKGGYIYYSDTDSIVTNIKLDSNMVNKNELGKLKLEYEVKKGIFITNKTYCIINSKDEFISKAKGVRSDSLQYKDFEELLEERNVITVRRESKLNWSEGDVKIYDRDITINSNSYNKRQKVYTNNKWTDTKPNIRKYHTTRYFEKYRNYFDKNIVIYKLNVVTVDSLKSTKLDNNIENNIINKNFLLDYKDMFYSGLLTIVILLASILIILDSVDSIENIEISEDIINREEYKDLYDIDQYTSTQLDDLNTELNTINEWYNSKSSSVTTKKDLSIKPIEKNHQVSRMNPWNHINLTRYLESYKQSVLVDPKTLESLRVSMESLQLSLTESIDRSPTSPQSLAMRKLINQLENYKAFVQNAETRVQWCTKQLLTNNHSMVELLDNIKLNNIKIEGIKNNVENKTVHIELLKNDLLKLQLDKSTLENSLKDIQDRLQFTNELLDSKYAEVDLKESKITSLNSQLLAKDKTIQEWEALLETNNDELVEYYQENSKLKEALTVTRSTINDLNSQLNEEKVKVKEHLKWYSDSYKQARQLVIEVEELKAKIDTLNKKS
jgi:hypothetical protein